MIDICPICGEKLTREVWVINPPNRGLKCTKCGRVEQIISKDDEIKHPRNNHRGRPVI